MNDNDKAGRYLVVRAPAGICRWLLAHASLTFDSWIDARRVVLPNQRDGLSGGTRRGPLIDSGLCVKKWQTPDSGSASAR
jgi:hypothetical protein